MNFKIPKIKNLSIHRQSSDRADDASRAWLTIVYIGFGLFAISVVFHIWLFFSAGTASAAVSSAVASVETIDSAKLNAVLSDYMSRQNEKISIASADSTLKDPSK